jgi:hypothetical protein
MESVKEAIYSALHEPGGEALVGESPVVNSNTEQV